MPIANRPSRANVLIVKDYATNGETVKGRPRVLLLMSPFLFQARNHPEICSQQSTRNVCNFCVCNE